jgi:hypothetical protein
MPESCPALGQSISEVRYIYLDTRVDEMVAKGLDTGLERSGIIGG